MTKVRCLGVARAVVLGAFVLGRPLLRGAGQGADLKPDATADTQALGRSYTRIYDPQHQRAIAAEGRDYVVRLSETKPCPECPGGATFLLEVRRTADHRIWTFTLANLTRQIDEALVVEDKAVILGRAMPNASLVTIVRLPHGDVVDWFLCYQPTVSPQRRYIGFVKFYPPHMGYGYWASNQYLVYDLMASPEQNRTAQSTPVGGMNIEVGLPAYPEGSKNVPNDNVVQSESLAHSMASDGFFWLDERTLTFVDQWQAMNRLVVVDLRDGIRKPFVSVMPLPTAEVVDFELCKGVQVTDFRRWSEHPELLIFVAAIEPSEKRKDFVRLRLRPNPCLKNDTLEISLSRPRRRS